MQIVIIGYGRMGRAIEKAALESNVFVSKIIKNYDELKNYHFQDSDVAIEFTTPDSCLNNLKFLAQKGIPTVCGTTGWYENIDQIQDLISKNNSALIYGANFSIGVHLFWKAVAESARIFDKVLMYDISLHERHHQNKKDAPSGTAKKTAEILIENLKRKNKFTVIEDPEEHIDADSIRLTYSREGDLMGKHIVKFDSEIDTIEISHTSKGRKGYALGSIECAKWIHKRKGLFSIDDYLKTI